MLVDERVPQRALKAAFSLAALFALPFVLGGHWSSALGLAIGAFIGLSSLWSLSVAIPPLFRPDNPAANLWLGLITLVKLPLYAVLLAFAMTSPAVNPFAVFVGVALVPTMLVMQALASHSAHRAKTGRSAVH